MFKYFLFFFFCLSLIGCVSANKRVSFKTHVHYSGDDAKKVKYSAHMPKGFKLRVVLAGGEFGTTKEFLYPDSSCLYISDYKQVSDPNYENIQKSGLISQRFTYSNVTAQSLCDTLNLEGIDSNGLYWKEVFIGKICIGYNKVREERKAAFDKAIKSFRCK